LNRALLGSIGAVFGFTKDHLVHGRRGIVPSRCHVGALDGVPKHAGVERGTANCGTAGEDGGKDTANNSTTNAVSILHTSFVGNGKGTNTWLSGIMLRHVSVSDNSTDSMVAIVPEMRL